MLELPQSQSVGAGQEQTEEQQAQDGSDAVLDGVGEVSCRCVTHRL